jgi:uncharacterized protein (TIGR04141 family)
MPENKQHHLTILLLKDGFESFDQAIRGDYAPEKHEIRSGGEFVGSLYVKPSFPHTPRWASFFQGIVDMEEIGKNATVAAVLLLEKEGKTFALTFGPGRYLLKPDSWVERFGLKVALNSIGKERIRSIDKTTFDAISRHSREQGSKETDVSEFGLDIEQDLLRAVTGVPKDRAIGKQIYGMDSLTVSTDTEIETIGDYLESIYAKYTDDSYQHVAFANA